MKYRVQFEAMTSVSVDVELDEEEIAAYSDPRLAAIDKGYSNLPGGICAQCSGWDRHWCRDEGEYEIAREWKDDENGERHLVEVEPELLEDGE